MVTREAEAPAAPPAQGDKSRAFVTYKSLNGLLGDIGGALGAKFARQDRNMVLRFTEAERRLAELEAAVSRLEHAAGDRGRDGHG